MALGGNCGRSVNDFTGFMNPTSEEAEIMRHGQNVGEEGFSELETCHGASQILSGIMCGGLG